MAERVRCRGVSRADGFDELLELTVGAISCSRKAVGMAWQARRIHTLTRRINDRPTNAVAGQTPAAKLVA